MSRQAGQQSNEGNRPKTHVPAAWLGPKADYRPMLPVTEPGLRITFGVAMIVLGSLSLFFPRLARIHYWMIALIGFGIAMIGSGLLQLRHEMRIRDELARADREWPELLAAARSAEDAGESIARCLQQRGYHHYFVRRWIADSLKNDLAAEPPATGVRRE